MILSDAISGRLLQILGEIDAQPSERADLQSGEMSFEDQLAEIRGFLEYAGEYGLAYEYIVGLLAGSRLVVSGPAAVALLEVGLLLGFKTESELDKVFDRRQ